MCEPIDKIDRQFKKLEVAKPKHQPEMDAAEVITTSESYKAEYEDPDETGTEKALDDLANLTNRIYELAKSSVQRLASGEHVATMTEQIATLPESDPVRRWAESRYGTTAPREDE